MTDPKIHAAIRAALQAFNKYHPVEAVAEARFDEAFASDKDFLSKVDDVDAVFDDMPQLEPLREIFFDLLMINFFSADVKKLEEDYLETQEWEDIEEETLDRGTELLNLLLYLNECRDEEIEPSLEDYLKEFLLVDEDEFQDEYSIYEPVIANQILIESPASEIKRVALGLPEDSELKELFYPMMVFFQDVQNGESSSADFIANAVDPAFDSAVYSILDTFE
ncbi:hypothetical protein [Mucilaginibacter polytrichastri]|uniref:Uncharacterized protein n=1 Tax=Mucilaginibacter polytrichastri TaxID=1302689 RepID=A0A1Q5ZVK7_9SPHI|nr:hypothetical protein [Mucilaginibacter polytrichastri]OKS85802.1 hypothetical protein RG47T_1248 [Mucilaginibacter polytrichastri]SFS61397.1 hypothetical protein SAMN04487890_102327 [Mucilaginibacter polytrichastri]